MSFIVENSKACLNGQCFQFLKLSGGSAMSKGQLQEIKASFNWLSETRKGCSLLLSNGIIELLGG